jgi:hypothetical protein
MSSPLDKVPTLRCGMRASSDSATSGDTRPIARASGMRAASDRNAREAGCDHRPVIAQSRAPMSVKCPRHWTKCRHCAAGCGLPRLVQHRETHRASGMRAAAGSKHRERREERAGQAGRLSGQFVKTRGNFFFRHGQLVKRRGKFFFLHGQLVKRRGNFFFRHGQFVKTRGIWLP